MGQLAKEKNEFPKALTHLKKALDINLQVFGDNHPEVALNL
jgi:hypothetical protein